jgi:glutathione S-transferase
MKLYYAETLAPRKTCALAKYLDAPIEYVYVDLKKGEQHAPAYLAINPNAKVPAMQDGERNLWEADAIMCHMAERMGSDLWPRDARQIDVARWFSWNAHHFYPSGGALYFEHIIRPHFGLGSPDPVAVEQALGGFRKCAAVLNAHLDGRKWLVGDGMTVADFSVAVALPYAARANLPLDEFPEVRRWHDQLNDIEAWREPFPARQTEIAHMAA